MNTKNIKNTLSLILTLVMVLGCLIFVSSCSFDLNSLINGESNTNGGETNTDTPEGETEKPETNGSSTSDTQSGTENPTEEAPQFCPDTNNPQDIDSLDPISKAMLSVVAIDAKLDLYTSYPYYDSDTTTEYTSYGSGIIYSLDRERGDAYIITNYHVVYNKDEVAAGGFSDGISLYLYGMEQQQYAIPATVVGGSMNYDIAVLKVEGSEVLKNSMATAVTLGDSEDIRVNDGVVVIGNPEGYGISLTDGSVSVESEALTMTGADGRTSIKLRVIRVSAAINDGNSGGGLFDLEGRLIGVVNAKRTGAEVDNIGYAIPVNLAKNLVTNILENCDGKDNLSIKKCVVGVEIVTATSGLVTDGNGNLVIREQVAVSKVYEDSLVLNSLFVDDIITSITLDGVTISVTRKHHLTDILLLAKVGSVITLDALRNGESISVTVTVTDQQITTVK